MKWFLQLLRYLHLIKESPVPNRFTPISPNSDMNQIIAMINKNFAELDAESNTKVYYGANNTPALIQGSLPNGAGSGTVLNDLNGVPVLTSTVDSSGVPAIKVGRGGASALTNDVLRIGQVAPGFYGIKTNDGTNDTFFAGTNDLGQSVVKVAKAGYDVKTATNEQLIFNSSQNVFKIVNTFSAGFSLVSGGVSPASTTVTINHNLGYIPLTQSTVNISTLTNGTPGIYPVPFFTPGVGGGTTNVFILLSYFRVSSVTSSIIRFELGIQAPTQTFSGTVTCYVLQESAT